MALTRAVVGKWRGGDIFEKHLREKIDRILCLVKCERKGERRNLEYLDFQLKTPGIPYWWLLFNH